MTYSSKGIVLSIENFGEADRYIQFLTKDWGVISVLAKSARKSKRRYVGGLDLFCHNEIFLRGDPKDRPYLNELSVLNSFPKLRENLDKVLLAGKIAHWIKKLANTPTPMPAIYSLMGQSLALIEKEQNIEKLDLLNTVFKLKLLSLIGLKPRVDTCAKCESEEDIEGVFDLNSGGILCRLCSPKADFTGAFTLNPTQRNLVNVADQIKLTCWDDISFSPELLSSINRLTTQFASFHTQVKLPI
ncbi:MAG: DNA repair protein RecO [Deltaproteobacteria bacterium]|jgi:DNA repair protein RecO (recombination protein O)